MRHETNLLIVGAGPFGLAIAAQASHVGIEHLVVGKLMEFWRSNMPKGMYLRSECDWHLDPVNVHTIESFLQSQGQTPRDVEPLSLEFYHSYVDWFQRQKQITPLPAYIRQLDHSTDNDHFVASTFDGRTIQAQKVVIAPGLKHFAHLPDELKSRLPAGRFSHTCDFVDFKSAANNRYLIVGGRQSAFEWAALLVEAGASEVYVAHRHDSPAFTNSDWSWVNPMVDAMAENPSWFRSLSPAEQEAIARKFFEEGRLKLEPWLSPRVSNNRVKILPRTEVVNSVEQNGQVLVELTNGDQVSVDQIILATGYKTNIAQLPLLSSGNILAKLATRNGFPVLDDHFQTSVGGLFITSMPATQDFGPFFGFTVAVRVSAKLICEAIAETPG